MLSSLQPPRHPSSSTLTLTCFLEKYEFNKTQRHDAHRAKFSLSEKTFYVLFLTTRNFQETHLPSPRNRHCFFFSSSRTFPQQRNCSSFYLPFIYGSHFLSPAAFIYSIFTFKKLRQIQSPPSSAIAVYSLFMASN